MFKRPYRKVIYRRKVMILLVQIVNRNLGDAVIAENAAYLVRQALPRLGRQHYVIQNYDIQSEDYELAAACDLMIFDGGGLIKYRQEDFHIYVPALLECAREHEIPVFFNSVGVEGYDSGDERCLRLARTLNYDCVRGITVRDDLETLRRFYLNNDTVFTAQAIDCAVFTPEAYGVHRQTQPGLIGLGIVRSRIFEDYGIPEITREFQLELWQGIIRELEARGYAWKFFANGLRSDYDFALEVLAHIGRAEQAEQYLVPRPSESRELVQAVASFEGVIACRMHANIIAYALGIPGIGLVWNDKMTFWGERTGYPQRFLKSCQFEPVTVVNSLEQSIREGVRPCPAALKNSVRKPLSGFIRRYGTRAWKKHRRDYIPKPQNWNTRLVAAALGGLEMRYTNMNTPQGLESSIRHGFRLLEADIRLTGDGQLVCVNGWSKGTYEKLGVQPDLEDGGSPGAMDYEAFMQCRMYGRFETMDAAQLLERMHREEGDWKLILDIGKPKKETLALIIEEFQKLCGGKDGWEKHLFMRLQSRHDTEAVQASGLPVQVMYYVPQKHKREEKNLTLDSIGKFCKKRGIQWVSLPKEALDEELMSYLHRQKLKSCVFSYHRYTDVLRALELGADWIAVSYLSPDGLNERTESGYTIVVR